MLHTLQGRPLRPGDQLPLGDLSKATAAGLQVPMSWRPSFSQTGQPWEVGVLPGPNAEPDYFTPEDIATFYSAHYKVHYNSYASFPRSKSSSFLLIKRTIS